MYILPLNHLQDTQNFHGRSTVQIRHHLRWIQSYTWGLFQKGRRAQLHDPKQKRGYWQTISSSRRHEIRDCLLRIFYGYKWFVHRQCQACHGVKRDSGHVTKWEVGSILRRTKSSRIGTRIVHQTKFGIGHSKGVGGNKGQFGTGQIECVGGTNVGGEVGVRVEIGSGQVGGYGIIGQE